MEKRAYGYVSEINKRSPDAELDNLLKELAPFDRVQDKNFRLGVLDGNNLKAKRFLLRPTDRQPITLFDPQKNVLYRFTHPGKSGFLYPGSEVPTREDLDAVIEKGIKRKRTRHDHLHLANLSDVESAGWKTFWAPLPGRDSWLHVRVVANITIEEGRNPGLEEAESLCSVFEKKI